MYGLNDEYVAKNSSKPVHNRNRNKPRFIYTKYVQKSMKQSFEFVDRVKFKETPGN
jgi:hypothetical protein